MMLSLMQKKRLNYGKAIIIFAFFFLWFESNLLYAADICDSCKDLFQKAGYQAPQRHSMYGHQLTLSTEGFCARKATDLQNQRFRIADQSGSGWDNIGMKYPICGLELYICMTDKCVFITDLTVKKKRSTDTILNTEKFVNTEVLVQKYQDIVEYNPYAMSSPATKKEPEYLMPDPPLNASIRAVKKRIEYDYLTWAAES